MKLALGTAQFGLDYGVTNLSGQVTIDEVRSILAFAKNNKIDTLDTASGYGNSERVLGRCGVNNYQIITKTISLENSVDKVIDGFYESLKNLGQKQVKGLLVHDIDNIENKRFDALFSKLKELKQQGLIKKIGFSVYTPEQVDFLLYNFEFDIIQVPINIFDQRLIQGRQLTKLKEKGIEIHARSIFLQGLLLNFNHLPNYFLPWQDNFNQYIQQLKDSNISKLSAALNFALSIEELDKIIVGVNTAKQLKELLNAIQETSNIQYENFAINDINLINPSLWKL